MAALTADAVGTAAGLSAGSIGAFQDGTDTKTLHVGLPLRSAFDPRRSPRAPANKVVKIADADTSRSRGVV